MDIFGKLVCKGKFELQKVAQITDVEWSTSQIGVILYDDDADRIYYGGQTQWKYLADAQDLFNVGQEIIFCQETLPDGWTITTDSDITVLITSDNTEIGDTDTDWAITGINIQNTRHNHYAPGGLGGPSSTVNVGKSDIYTTGNSATHTHYMGNDETHLHTFDGLWRPANVKFQLAVYGG